jgi:hypothetical protein
MNSEKEISKEKDNLISIKVYINIEYDQNTINEYISLDLRKNISVREMIKEIVNNFNIHFEEKEINIKLKTEGLGYEIINYNEISSDKENKTHKNVFKEKQKLYELNTTNFKLIYDPSDILINFETQKVTCVTCSII